MATPPRRFLRRASTPEIEAVLGIERNEPERYTQNDVQRLTRRHLGRLWGRKRRPLEPR